MRRFVLLLQIFIAHHLPAQGNVELIFNPFYGNEKVELHKTFRVGEKDSLSIDKFKFYVSGIEFRLADVTVWSDVKGYYLMDLQEGDLRVQLQNVPSLNYDQLVFQLGVDSIMSVSGALGGDLDPTLGMYWAWQSGYINMKLEGNTSLSSTGKFVFHIGGYSFPNKALRKVALDVKPATRHLLYLQLDQFFSAIDFKSLSSVMSPGKSAMKLADEAIRMFSINKK